jgi:uncharacterized repeat protein (TIGR04138 family)
MNAAFNKKVEEIVKKDPRYMPDAYEFTMQALWFAQKKLKRQGHISGKELLEYIRKFALEQYGPMAKTLIQFWGVQKTEDFGEIVFNLIDTGLMKKTEEDTLDDFSTGYDFNQAFDVFKINASGPVRKNKAGGYK